jgi:hypothetical protein
MANRVTAWLQGANGFQRLWFVLSVLLLFYLALVNPFVLTANNNQFNYKMKWGVEQDFANPQCQPYLNKPIADLAEPPYSEKSNCRQLYNHRKYGRSSEALPYTREMYEREFFWDWWDPILKLSAVGIPVALIIAAMVYWTGKVIAWIVRGFR